MLKPGDLTEDQVEEITAYRERGKSVPWIAQRFNLRPGSLDRMLRDMGVFPEGWTLKVRSTDQPYLRKGAVVRPYSEEEDAQLQSLRLERRTLTDIAKRLDRKPGSVRARLIALANKAQLEEAGA